MIKGIIFDLDGVIVNTDKYHFEAWKKLAGEENIYFDYEINERLRGVSRMESLDIILKKASKEYGVDQKESMAYRKNQYYKELIQRLTPEDILPGVINILKSLEERGLKKAIGSSSKNTVTILEKIGLLERFDAIADGNCIKMSKPDPEVFLLAADLLHLETGECIVIEDAYAGIDAAKAAGAVAVAIGSAVNYRKADYVYKNMQELDLDFILRN